MHTIEKIRELLDRLDAGPADAIESETLECKSWNPARAARDSQIRSIRESVVCFANARGGTILLGVADSKRSRSEAIQGVEGLDVNDLRRKIYDGTEPHILVEIEELSEPEGTILLIRVPKGIPPHTTSEGVGKIRIGKDCKPLTGANLMRLFVTGGQHDLSAEVVPEATLDDLDPEQVELLQKTATAETGRADLSRLPSEDLLAHLDLVREGEITIAAILLAGTPRALRRWIPQHEVVFLRFKDRSRYDFREDLKGPLLSLLEDLRQILRANLRISAVATEGFRELTVPDITWWAAREAVLNAVVHRDYFLRQSVQIELREDRLDVHSPGGFVGGVTAENVLRHPPVRRNPLLAAALQTVGLVNRAGLGVDRIYEELLRTGKGLPRYEADESHVRLTLPTRTHEAFAKFVSEEKFLGNELELDDLVVLRSIVDRGELDRWSGAEVLQLREEEAATRLASLRERGYLVAHGRGRGTSYRLARKLSHQLRGRAETDRTLPLDDEAVRLRVQAVLAERESLTNADIRRLSGYSRNEVVRLMRSLRDEGVAVLKGKGRGAHYVPGPEFDGGNA